MAAVADNPYQPPQPPQEAEIPANLPLPSGLYPLARVANLCLRLYLAATTYTIVRHLYETFTGQVTPLGRGTPLYWLNLTVSLVSLASTVLFFVWKYRAAANARLIDPAQMKISPGMAVGGYFIPVAQLVIPYLAMAGIARASGVERFWVGAWWASYLGSFAWVTVVVMAIRIESGGKVIAHTMSLLDHLAMLWSLLTFYFSWQIMVRVTRAQMAPAPPQQAAIPA